jgi:hypothetical protein
MLLLFEVFLAALFIFNYLGVAKPAFFNGICLFSSSFELQAR